MKLRTCLSLMAILSLAGCVSKAEFNAYKVQMEARQTSIKASGEAVDAWIAQAQLVLKFVADHSATICPACDPPAAPPSPPPDGGWGI